MDMQFKPFHEDFGVEVQGVDLTQALDDRAFAELFDAFNQHGLLLFRDQGISPIELGDFARRFPNNGEPPPYQTYLHPDCEDITLLGNVEDSSGSPAYLNKIGIEWHTDGTSSQTPAIATLLYCVQAPAAGGETLFASGYALWDAQPGPVKRQIEHLSVRYDFDQLLQRQAKLNDVPLEQIRQKWRTRFIPVEYPMVRVHPVTQRKALWVTWAEMDSILGMSREGSLSLVMELLQRGTTDPHVYAHRWQQNDLVVWDNRCMFHTTTPYTYESEQRLMYRIGLNGNIVGL